MIYIYNKLNYFRGGLKDNILQIGFGGKRNWGQFAN